jgi:hypothetical protein
MKKYVLVLMVIIAAAQGIQAQDEPEQTEKKGFDKSKLFFGGNFGLGFGTNTFVNVSPQVGYRFNDYLAAGVGVNFNYYSYKTYFSDGNYSRSSLGYTGFNVFGRVYPIKFIFIQAQPELNYSWGSTKYSNTEIKDRLPGQFAPSLLIGGGAAIPMGTRNGALLLMMQYDVLQENRSPYGNKPFFTLGYNF